MAVSNAYYPEQMSNRIAQLVSQAIEERLMGMEARLDMRLAKLVDRESAIDEYLAAGTAVVESVDQELQQQEQQQEELQERQFSSERSLGCASNGLPISALGTSSLRLSAESAMSATPAPGAYSQPLCATASFMASSTDTTDYSSNGVHVPISSTATSNGRSIVIPNENSRKDHSGKRVGPRLTTMLVTELNRRDAKLEGGPVRKMLQKLVTHPAFDGFFGIMIFVNALSVGLEVEYKTTHAETHSAFVACSYTFTGIFVTELACRLMAVGQHLLLYADWKWIAFDFIMVVVSIADIIGMNLADDIVESVLRIIRILRLMRIVRVLRFVPALRMIIASIGECLKTLFWVVMLLFIVLYFFSLCFTMAATEYSRRAGRVVLSDADAELLRKVELHYSTVARSLYSCLKAMLDGQSWGELLDPLIHVNWIYAVIFIVFIVFSIMMLLNIVTGAFVNGAMEKTANERVIKAEREVHRRNACVEHLKQIFLESDEDKSGLITQEMFNKHMRDPTVEPYISALNVDTSNIAELFHLLDKDQSGTIDLHEFVSNLMELMNHSTCGPEKQIRNLAMEQHRMKHTCTKMLHHISPSVSQYRPATAPPRHRPVASVQVVDVSAEDQGDDD